VCYPELRLVRRMSGRRARVRCGRFPAGGPPADPRCSPCVRNCRVATPTADRARAPTAPGAGWCRTSSHPALPTRVLCASPHPRVREPANRESEGVSRRQATAMATAPVRAATPARRSPTSPPGLPQPAYHPGIIASSAILTQGRPPELACPRPGR